MATFLEKLSEKVENVYVRSLIRHVARESFTHRDFLLSILKDCGYETGTADCRERIGDAGYQSILRYKQLSERLDAGWIPSLKEVVEMLEDEVKFESLVGEENYAKLGYRVAALSACLEPLLFEELAVEEEYHARLLKKAIEELLKTT